MVHSLERRRRAMQRIGAMRERIDLGRLAGGIHNDIEELKRRGVFEEPTPEERVAAAISGTGPFLKDYLVDDSDTGTNGRTETTPHGHTYKVFDTVQAAVTDGVATFSREFSIGLAPGVYNEAVVIPDTFSWPIHIFGGGGGFGVTGVTVIGGSASVGMTMGITLASSDLFLYDLELDGPSGGVCFTGNSNCKVHATNVIFRRDMAGDHAGSQFSNCRWLANIIVTGTQTPDNVTIAGGSIDGNIDFSGNSQSKELWTVNGLRCFGVLKLTDVRESDFNILFCGSGAGRNSQIEFLTDDSFNITLDCVLLGPATNTSQAILVNSGIEVYGLRAHLTLNYTLSVTFTSATRFLRATGTIYGGNINIAAGVRNNAPTFPVDDSGVLVSGVFNDSVISVSPGNEKVEITSGSGNRGLSGDFSSSAPETVIYPPPTEGTVNTTDATPTTLLTVAIPASTSVQIEMDVIARRTGGTAGTAEDAASYRRIGTYKTVAGTVTLVGALSAIHVAEDQAGWEATLVISGTNVIVQVTGAINNNVSWQGTARVKKVTS